MNTRIIFKERDGLLQRICRKTCLTMIFAIAVNGSHSKMRVYGQVMNSFRDAASCHDTAWFFCTNTKVYVLNDGYRKIGEIKKELLGSLTRLPSLFVVPISIDSRPHKNWREGT